MPARALIVLLLILNLGVALWWATRGDPAPAPDVRLPEGVEPLRLLADPQPAAAPPGAQGGGAAAPAPATAPAPGLEPDPLLRPAPQDPPGAADASASRCHRLGPFADAAAAGRAATALRPAVLRLALRETRAAPRGWDVRLPGLPDRAAAEAMVARLTAAGFGDHYLMPADDDGSVDIALGRFGSDDSAQRHRDALRDAGFDAVAAPIGDDAGARHWIHVAIGEGADLAALQRAAGAARAAGVDCASLSAAGR